MVQYQSSLRGVEYAQQVGLPTAEIDDIFMGDSEYIFAGDDQDFAQGYDETAGQWFWRFPTVVAPNEPILNIFNGVIGETITTPAAGVLANTENTIVIWGGTGAVASYTFIQGGIGVTSGTTRFRALTNSLGVDIDINVVTPVIDIGADVFEAGTFIDIAYDTAETLTGALIGVNIDLATNVTGGSQVVTGMLIVLPSTAIGATSNALDIVGPQTTSGLIDINPNGTATGNVINITPSVAITAGTIWQGISITGTALDPLTGAVTTIIGIQADFQGIVSADGNDARIDAFNVLLATGDTAQQNAYRHALTELTVAGNQTTVRSFNNLVLSATATYTGIFIDWDTVTRDANAPVLEGVRIDWPAATTSFGTSFPFLITDGTNTLMSITFATEIANLIAIAPRGAGTQTIIGITPSVALAAGSVWFGIDLIGTLLDPLTGVATNMVGFNFDFSATASADGNDALISGFRALLPTGDTGRSYAFNYTLAEMIVTGEQTGFMALAGFEVLSASATYRGFWANWDQLTRDANAPVLEGIRIDWPATVASFGTSYPFVLTDGTNLWMTIVTADGTVVHPTLRIYDAGGTDLISFYDDDSYSYIFTNPNPLRFTHGTNSAQLQNYVCGFATEPTLSGGAVLGFTGVTGTTWASGDYAGGAATKGSWLFNNATDEILFSLPLPELFVDTGVAGEFVLGLTFTTTNATDRFDYAIYDEDGALLVDEVDQALGATSGTFTINLGALAIAKGDSIVVALIGFETTAPADTTTTITDVELTYEVGIENNVA